jgi:hypothetical protein
LIDGGSIDFGDSEGEMRVLSICCLAVARVTPEGTGMEKREAIVALVSVLVCPEDGNRMKPGISSGKRKLWINEL